MPLHDRNAGLVHEPRQIEDVAEGDGGDVVSGVVGRREGREDGDAVRDVPEVDEVHERHHVVRWLGREKHPKKKNHGDSDVSARGSRLSGEREKGNVLHPASNHVVMYLTSGRKLCRKL